MKFIKAVWQAIKNVCRKIMKAAEYIAAGAAGAADAALNKADRKDVPGMLDSLAVTGSLATFGTSAIGALFKCKDSRVQAAGFAVACVLITGGIAYNYKKELEAKSAKDILDAQAAKDILDAQAAKDILDAQERKDIRDSEAQERKDIRDFKSKASN